MQYPGCRPGVFVLGSPVAKFLLQEAGGTLPRLLSSRGGNRLHGFGGRAAFTVALLCTTVFEHLTAICCSLGFQAAAAA